MSEPPEKVWFTDRDLDKRFPALLAAAGLHVESHAENFLHDAPDAEWLPQVANRGWIVVTHDQRIRYNALEIQAAMNAGVRVAILIGKGLRHDQLAEMFLTQRSRLERLLDSHPDALIAKVRRDEVKLWISHSEWIRRKN